MASFVSCVDLLERGKGIRKGFRRDKVEGQRYNYSAPQWMEIVHRWHTPQTVEAKWGLCMLTLGIWDAEGGVLLGDMMKNDPYQLNILIMMGFSKIQARLGPLCQIPVCKDKDEVCQRNFAHGPGCEGGHSPVLQSTLLTHLLSVCLIAGIFCQILFYQWLHFISQFPFP